MGDLTTPEQTVYGMMQELSGSGYQFRVVVVGKGAILETTTPLGPVLKLTQSPSTGEQMSTMEDRIAGGKENGTRLRTNPFLQATLTIFAF